MDSAHTGSAPARPPQIDRTIDRPKPPQLHVYFPASKDVDFRENKRRAEAAIGAVLDATDADKHTQLTLVPGDVEVQTVKFQPRKRSGNESEYKSVLVILTLRTEEALAFFRQSFPISPAHPAGTKCTVNSDSALKYLWPVKRSVYHAYIVEGAEGRLSPSDLAGALQAHKVKVHSYDRLRSEGLRFVSSTDRLVVVSGKDIPKQVTVGLTKYKLHWLCPAEDPSTSPRTFAAAAAGPASHASIQAREAIKAVTRLVNSGRNSLQVAGLQEDREEGVIPQAAVGDSVAGAPTGTAPAGGPAANLELSTAIGTASETEPGDTSRPTAGSGPVGGVHVDAGTTAEMQVGAGVDAGMEAEAGDGATAEDGDVNTVVAATGDGALAAAGAAESVEDAEMAEVAAAQGGADSVDHGGVEIGDDNQTLQPSGLSQRSCTLKTTLWETPKKGGKSQYLAPKSPMKLRGKTKSSNQLAFADSPALLSKGAAAAKSRKHAKPKKLK